MCIKCEKSTNNLIFFFLRNCKIRTCNNFRNCLKLTPFISLATHDLKINRNITIKYISINYLNN